MANWGGRRNEDQGTGKPDVKVTIVEPFVLYENPDAKAPDFKANPEWNGPFKTDTQAARIIIDSKFEISFDCPQTGSGWQQYKAEQAGPSAKLLFIHLHPFAKLGISSGKLGPNNQLDFIAASPAFRIAQGGGNLDLAISIPTIVEGADAGHYFQCPMKLSGEMVMSSEKTVQAFMWNSIVRLGNQWFSFETLTAAPDLDVSREMQQLTKFHDSFKVKAIGK